MNEMQIRTFGKTAEQATPTRNQVVATMREIEAVRRTKGEHEYLCPYFYAKAITARVMANATASRIAAKAARMDRIWRAKRKLATA
jgi:hypothetical protein